MEKPKLWILTLMVSFAAVNATLFTPALPEMGTFFKVTPQEIQLTITLFLLGYCLGNLIYGPLASAYGRKSILKMSILFTIIMSVLILLAGDTKNLSLLLIARFFQAVGAVGAMKITLTMISDSFNEQESARALSFVLTSFAIAPGVAIFIGGFLTDWFGWQSTFYFLILYSVIFFYLATLLPETLPNDKKQPLCLSTSLSNYKHALKNSRLILGGLIMGLGTTCVYLYSTAGPFVGIDHLGLTPSAYGLYNLIPSVGMLLGSLINAQVVKKLRPISALQFGMYILFLGSLWMLLTFLIAGASIIMLFLPISFIYIGIGLDFPNATAIALAHSHNRSYASAVLNTLNMGTAVIAVLILSLIPVLSTNTLPILLIIATALALTLYFLLRKKVNQSTP